MANISVVPVTTAAQRRAFMDLPWTLYRDDPHWVPPLRHDVKKTLSPSYPFFEHGKAQTFLALDGDRPVGRISAQFSTTHLDIHRDGRGFFGWFESVNDPAVARELVAAAAAWLRLNGPNLTHMRGPLQWDMNGEATGLLVSSDQPGPPLVLMPHNPLWYESLLTAGGMTGVMDLHAFIVHHDEALEARLARLASGVMRRLPGVTLRPIATGSAGWKQDMATVHRLYNEAWADNWGATPISEGEMAVIASGLKAIADRDLTSVAEFEGRPVGFIVAVPDINPLLRELNGRLLPFGWLKLLRGLKTRIRGFRTMLMGVSAEYRNKGLELAMVERLYQAGKRKNQQYCELSWILETNAPMMSMATKVGAPWRRYRLFEHPLTPPP